MGYHTLVKGTVYDSNSYSFTKSKTNDFMHIDYIAQDSRVSNAWTTFILDDSNGFTKIGVERINESIRTYCWAILDSQSQTRTNILGAGTTSDAQKQFLTNVKDAINSPVDLPSQIARYQKHIKICKKQGRKCLWKWT